MSAKDIVQMADQVYVTVIGTDDLFFAPVDKVVALRLLREANGQLVAVLHGGDAYIERRQ